MCVSVGEGDKRWWLRGGNGLLGKVDREVTGGGGVLGAAQAFYRCVKKETLKEGSNDRPNPPPPMCTHTHTYTHTLTCTHTLSISCSNWPIPLLSFIPSIRLSLLTCIPTHRLTHIQLMTIVWLVSADVNKRKKTKECVGEWVEIWGREED